MEYTEATLPAELTQQRMHEACGVGRFAFAAMRASSGDTPIVWIVCPRSTTSLCPPGFARFFNPMRLIVMQPPKPKEVLWCMEETLRSGPAFVVADLETPTNLTQSRRLQLAAQSGGSTGLCLIPEGPVNNAAETRWRSSPLPCASDSTLYHWELIKNKKGILNSCIICWDDESRSVRMVSASGGGTGVAPPSCARPITPLRGGGDAQERVAALLAQRDGSDTRVVGRDGVGRRTGDPARFEKRDRTAGTASLISDCAGAME